MSEESQDSVGKSGWSQVIGRHRQFLLDHMDPDFGLLGHLISNETLSYEQEEIVKSHITTNQRNSKLLDIVRSEDKWDGLISALRSSKQIHVINYLEDDGKHCSNHDWPLGEQEAKILRANHAELIELLEVQELVGKLFSMKAINRSQRDFIQTRQASSEQNEAFIKILRRRSIGDYNETIYCLKKTNQPHIAQLLEEGGGIVRVHVNTDLDPEDEKEIAMITQMIIRRPSDKRRRFLNRINLDVIAAKPGQSIVLFVYLKTMKELNQLKESLDSESFKNSVQLFFNAVKSGSNQATVSSVTVARDELRRVEDFLRGTYQDERKISVQIQATVTDEQKNEITTSSPSINDLPLELLDFVLQKCYLFCALQSYSEQLIGNKAIITRLAVANLCWYRRLTKRKFKRLIWRHLFQFYVNQRQRHFIIRNNSHYLEYSLQLPNQIRHLKFSDCLTDLQAACVQRKNRNIRRTKNRTSNLNYALEVIEIVKSLDENRYSAFIRCLRQTGRQKISRTVANGGAVIPLKCWEKAKPKSQASNVVCEMSDKLKETEFLDANQPKHKFRELDMEILEVNFDRTNMYVCWIWCRSTKALENLKEAGVSKPIFRESFKTHIDIESFEKTMNFRSEVDSDWPLTGSQQKKLNDHQQSLVDCIKMDNLVDNLHATKVINPWQKELIDSMSDLAKKNEVFLKILRRLSKMDFAITIECLYKSSQNYSAEILEGRVGLATLDRHKTFIVETIDSDSGLLEKLLSTRTLTAKECRSIRREPTYYIARNAKLLEYITDEVKCASFLDSLRDTRQTHVINYLMGYGIHRVEFGDDWPLTDTQLQILRSNLEALVDLIDLSELLGSLYSRAVINKRQHDIIASKSIPHEQNQAFLEILRHLSQEHFRQTIRCLRETRQSHVAEILDNGREKSGWFDIVGHHRQFLLDYMDPDFGLLTTLVARGTLSFEQRDIVKTESTVNKRNYKLLDIIQNEEKWDELIEALRSSNQTHVVNYLKADGSRSSDDDWPLGEREEKILRDNLEQLIDLIEVTQLVMELYSTKVINKSQRDFIFRKHTSSKQNEAFLDILRRRSIKDYKKTIDCLKKTNQSHIARLLEEGGGLVRLRVNTDLDVEAEKEFAEKIADVLANTNVEERCRLFEGVQRHLIKTKPENSGAP